MVVGSNSVADWLMVVGLYIVVGSYSVEDRVSVTIEVSYTVVVSSAGVVWPGWVMVVVTMVGTAPPPTMVVVSNSVMVVDA